MKKKATSLITVGRTADVYHGVDSFFACLWYIKSGSTIPCEKPYLERTQGCFLFPILAALWGTFPGRMEQ